MENNSERNVFLRSGNTYKLIDSEALKNDVVWPLNRAVYNLSMDKNGNLFLEFYKPEFDFNFQCYPIDDKFIDHVIKRYPTMSRSMGILLNGEKGTGKSVIAKTIANKLGLPVIILSANLPGLVEFISKINFPCCFFMDEFEKNFAERGLDDENIAGQELLSVMDGVYTGGIPHVFLLTTNQDTINPNLISRPGRILYSRNYKSLSFDLIDSYINDNLKDLSKKDNLLSELSQVKEVTIDICKSIIEEMNVMGIDATAACEYLNVEKGEWFIDCISIYSNQRPGPFSRALGLSNSKSNTINTVDEFKQEIEVFRKLREKVKNQSSSRSLEDMDAISKYQCQVVKSNKRPSELKTRDSFNNDKVLEVHDNGKYIKTVNQYSGEICWYCIESIETVNY